jgi:amino acid adenylation domain-containing protein
MECIYCEGCRTTQAKIFNRKKPFKRHVKQVRNDILAAQKYTSTFLFDFISPNSKLIDYCKKIWEGIDLSSHFCVYTNVYTPSAEIINYVNQTFKYVYWDFDLASLSERHRMQMFSKGLVKPQPTDNEMLEFFDHCQEYKNNEVRINLINGLPYFTASDIKESEKMLSHIMSSYSCFSDLHWARLHAQPAAPIVENCSLYDMHSYATTFEDFLTYSQKNFDRTSPYPTFENYQYPFIYFNDDGLNAEVSRHYADINIKLSGHKEKRKRNWFTEERLTYMELNKKANALARLLKEKGVKTEHIVSIMLESSIEMVVSILGVLKAGAAYLPIDPNYPEARIKYILADSRAHVLITTGILAGESSKLRALESKKNIVIIFPDSFESSSLSPTLPRSSTAYPSSHPHLSLASATSLAYLIYTSGTTGKPKGILGEHRGLVNYSLWRINTYGYTQDDITLQPLSYCFDGFGSNLYSSLFSGGKLVIIPDSRRLDFNYLKNTLYWHQVTNVSLTPGIYRMLLDNARKKELKSLRFVVLAGERSGMKLIKESQNKLPDTLLINEYGPTEATVTAASHPGINELTVSIIGKPIANTRIYIFDNRLQLLPIKALGELCISGVGLARGYLNNPQLTSEKFIENPYAPGNRLYQTGDSASRLTDGSIRFAGRTDEQVKIRGNRIELGEIENQLLNHKDIKEAMVIAKQGKETESYLCAYIVSNLEITVSELRDYLLYQLPEYMIPTYIVQIDEIPLTSHGKLNKRLLPEPEGHRQKLKTTYITPETEIAKHIAHTWKKVLSIDRVGIHDNFFELGGNSLKIIQVNSQLNESLGREIPIIDMYKYPTIHTFSQYLEQEENNTGKSMSTVQIDRTVELNKAREFRAKQRARRKQ